MILGTAKFGFDYNGKQVEKKEVFKCLEYFENNGGDILDSAHNYREAILIIAEYIKAHGSKIKIITKIWDKEEFIKDYELLGQEKIYCCMARENSKDRNIIEYIKGLKEQGIIEKTGMTLYYKDEIRSDMNVLFIPNNFEVFKENLKVMILHSDIHVRSFFNLNNKDIDNAKKDYLKFKQFERKDLNHKIEAVIGIDNLEQLKYDIEVFR